jgi:Uma2 family endonuclease
MNSLETGSDVEPIIDPEVVDSFRALPTEDDLPYDDGEPMETARHRDQMILLIESLKAYWAERRDYYVGGNMFVHYNLEQKRQFRGPDFFLVLDVDGTRERKSWVVWQEGMRFPDVIIELLSDSTRQVDKSEKKELYARVFHTAEYYLYDPFSYDLIGYQLKGVQYEEMRTDTEGELFSPSTGLSLVVREGWLRWMTQEGELVPTPQESAQRAQQLAEQERQRAEQEQRRAEQERQRADQEQRRAEQERQRADQERQRAEQERQRAGQEQRRAEQAEQLLEAYQRRFGRLEES